MCKRKRDSNKTTMERGVYKKKCHFLLKQQRVGQEMLKMLNTIKQTVNIRYKEIRTDILSKY